MTVGPPHNDEAGANLGRDPSELRSGTAAIVRHLLGGKHAVARQPADKVLRPGQCPWSSIHVLNDFGDDHILGLAKHRQCVGNGPPGLGRVVLGDQNIAQIEPVAGFGNNQQRPSRLHQEIARIGLHEWVAKCIAATPSHDNNVGSASLLDDKSPWKILRTRHSTTEARLRIASRNCASASARRFLIAARP